MKTVATLLMLASATLVSCAKSDSNSQSPPAAKASNFDEPSLQSVDVRGFATFQAEAFGPSELVDFTANMGRAYGSVQDRVTVVIGAGNGKTCLDQFDYNSKGRRHLVTLILPRHAKAGATYAQDPSHDESTSSDLWQQAAFNTEWPGHQLTSPFANYTVSILELDTVHVRGIMHVVDSEHPQTPFYGLDGEFNDPFCAP